MNDYRDTGFRIYVAQLERTDKALLVLRSKRGEDIEAIYMETVVLCSRIHAFYFPVSFLSNSLLVEGERKSKEYVVCFHFRTSGFKVN